MEFANLFVGAPTMSREKLSENATEQETADAQPDIERQIRARAHILWESEGKAEGRDEEYWLRAKQLIEDEAKSAYPPTQSRPNRT
jgi:hypothetical protein